MIAIICHDAGGAEILSSWVSGRDKQFCFALDGPAKRIFARKCPKHKIVPVHEAIDQSEWVLLGAGWETRFERDALVNAKQKNKHTVVFLDHWVNYLSRLTLDGNIVLPDEFWVGDPEALNIAKDCFPSSLIKLVSNPYFEELKKELNTNKNESKDPLGINVLYVTEPIDSHADQLGQNLWNYSEHDALSFFIRNISVLDLPVRRVIIRLHPAENKNKYDYAQDNLKSILIDGQENSLIDAIKNVDVVVGCETVAMVVGLLAKKRVISSIPPRGKKCGLPFEKIEYLRDIVGNKNDPNNAL